jgi:2-iminobutanoate/2-iminopropanoate deaminase
MANPIGPYSPIRLSGKNAYVSGQIALDPISGKLSQSSIENETERVMKNIEQLLRNVDLSLSHIIKATLFLTDMNDFDSVNKVYASHFVPPYPARSTVEVRALPKGARIKIECIAES